MSQEEKFVKKLKEHPIPNNIRFKEVESFLQRKGFRRIKTGKTGGSRVKFYNAEIDCLYTTHEPHPSGIMKRYQISELREKLIEYEVIDIE